MTPRAAFIALDVAPQQAYADVRALRAGYPGLSRADGLFNAVDPTPGRSAAGTWCSTSR